MMTDFIWVNYPFRPDYFHDYFAVIVNYYSYFYCRAQLCLKKGDYENVQTSAVDLRTNKADKLANISYFQNKCFEYNIIIFYIILKPDVYIKYNY